MLESMVAGLWVSALIGLRHPLRMLPILLFAFAASALWLIDYGLPGAATPQFRSDLWTIGGAAMLIALVMPWGHVWRLFVTQPGERLR
jgi:hypothetical protein